MCTKAASLATELIEQLIEATVGADVNQFKALLEGVPDTIAAPLRQLCERYDYDQILVLLRRAGRP